MDKILKAKIDKLMETQYIGAIYKNGTTLDGSFSIEDLELIIECMKISKES